MISVKSMDAFSLENQIKAISLLLIIISVSHTAKANVLNNDANNATIIGKVFNDINSNGVQDANEYGIPGVRLATVTGLQIETDGYGRYHIPDNEINPKQARNFILKIDKASLPIGSRILSENPRVIRLTNTSVQRINFSINY